MTKASVLIVDDEKNILSTLSRALRIEDYEVDVAGSAAIALGKVATKAYDAILLDVMMPEMDGITMLRKLREGGNETPVIVMSGHGTIDTALEATRLGARDFIEKPIASERLLLSLEHALQLTRLEAENAELRQLTGATDDLLGDSGPMRQLKDQVALAASANAPVLVQGERGTGKELVARAIHLGSKRAEQPYEKLNCAAVPAELIESELFGHEAGAFTGATKQRRGKFERASGGTLFLDEVGDMPSPMQAKLLRVLQEGEIERVGGSGAIKVDVRVVAATNKDLEKAITDGEFREDLFFRLNVVPLRSPGLRERRDDIPALAAAFLRDFCAENGLKDKPIGPEVLERLQQKAWPGNVRELRNVVERMAILSGDVIEIEDLPADGKLARAAARESGDATPDPIHDEDGRRLTLREYRDRAERRYLVSTLEECEWNVSKAASMLGVERTNLHKKMRSLGVQRDEP